MKKRILTVAAIIVCLALLGAGTLAYFTDEATAHNVITSNGIDIEIAEYHLSEKDELEPYPSEPIAVMPGVSVSKIVQVDNLDATAWIRANVTIVVKDAEGVPMNLSADTLASIIALDYNTEAWTAKDGWFYHNEPVAKGDSTESLFETVKFSGPNMTNEYQNCTVEIIVDAQATQHANNGATALEAAGWPAA